MASITSFLTFGLSKRYGKEETWLDSMIGQPVPTIYKGKFVRRKAKDFYRKRGSRKVMAYQSKLRNRYGLN